MINKSRLRIRNKFRMTTGTTTTTTTITKTARFYLPVYEQVALDHAPLALQLRLDLSGVNPDSHVTEAVDK
jgi:hypothetical protein